MRIRLLVRFLSALFIGISATPSYAAKPSTKLEYAAAIMESMDSYVSVMSECGDEAGRNAIRDRLVALVGLFVRVERTVANKDNPPKSSEEIDSLIEPYADLLKKYDIFAEEPKSRSGRIKHACPTTAVFLVSKFQIDAVGNELAGHDWFRKTDAVFFGKYKSSGNSQIHR